MSKKDSANLPFMNQNRSYLSPFSSEWQKIPVSACEETGVREVSREMKWWAVKKPDTLWDKIHSQENNTISRSPVLSFPGETKSSNTKNKI